MQKEVSAFLKKVWYKTKTVPFVPISGFHGDNLVEPLPNMPWYNGWEIEKTIAKKRQKFYGKTLLSALDAIAEPVRPNFKVSHKMYYIKKKVKNFIA